MKSFVILLGVGIWLIPAILLWILANRFRSNSGSGKTAAWAFTRGLAIGWLVAPSVASGGMAVVPAPASIGLLTAIFAQQKILWGQVFISIGSLALCSLIAFAIIRLSTKP